MRKKTSDRAIVRGETSGGAKGKMEAKTMAEDQQTVTEDVGSQPTATTGAAVGSTVEAQQARDQRNQAIAQARPRFTRKKSIARRKKRTSAISSDSEPESPPPGSKAKPGASMPKDHPKDLFDSQHHHTYVPVVNWSYSRLHKRFTLTLSNGGIKVVNLVQLFALAAPFVFDLEKLPLENPDEGQEGRQAVRWAKARAQTNTLRKEEITLRKQHYFRRITYSYRKVYKTTASEGSASSRFKASEVASEEQKLPKTFLC
ncbi:hypothetical protein E3N88_27872 [Mikania micrantha]|uniref:Uncharacterized protein n=1 Tax=Mikania micrantha TaxID=192012 RepID=A0A5N6MYG4_9ASTR|nr:hypothetical protein E3N88_27872 [Mikania micrantha]